MRSVIGSILFFLYVVIYTPIHATLLLLLSPVLSIRNRYVFACWWNAINIHMLKWLCGIQFKVEGMEHLPNTGAIVLAKHQSAWETFAIPVLLLPRHLCLIYKRELQYVPFFGWALWVLRMVPVDRKNGVEAFEFVKKMAGERMRQGAWMMFFPEGTRVPVGYKRRYKTGGTRLAVATNTPVVPVAHDAGEYWKRKGFFKKAGTVTLRFGKPISPEGHNADSLMKAVEDWIEGQMHQISPHRYTSAETPLVDKK
ncbi:MAG TPA: lysophospholipid acyltransferase family protein [Limnobacter sp.]|uniref:lysophospholipid acyltransferase family protein n=1 Tax=Limnobacter sp. TaxID=2003368 RepID=UPI002EDABD16